MDFVSGSVRVNCSLEALKWPVYVAGKNNRIYHSEKQHKKAFKPSFSFTLFYDFLLMSNYKDNVRNNQDLI